MPSHTIKDSSCNGRYQNENRFAGLIGDTGNDCNDKNNNISFYITQRHFNGIGKQPGIVAQACYHSDGQTDAQYSKALKIRDKIFHKIQQALNAEHIDNLYLLACGGMNGTGPHMRHDKG